MLDTSGQKLKVKYGLPTAIAMVVGIVIGSGIFFKAEKVLNITNGDLKLGILAWILGGFVMVISAYVFAILASEYSQINGLVDYAENIIGKKYATMFAWFLALIYYPAMTSVVAWVAARYFCTIFGYDITGPECLTLSSLCLILIYVLNVLSPILAGKFQVSTTIIKLIPLYIMAIVGVFMGLRSGLIMENFSFVGDNSKETLPPLQALLTAVTGTVFAFEGWVLATSVNSEIKNSKKNLPIALLIGTIIVAVTYIVYYVGLSGVVKNQVLMESGENAVKIAFSTIFGNIGGLILMIFVVISCLGTVNGLMMATSRGIYALASRKVGFSPKVMDNIDPDTNMPVNSSVIGLLVCELWLVYFYGSNLQGTWFVPFVFDSSEIPLVTIYAMYIPLYIAFIKKHKKLNIFNRFVMPILALICALFILYACFKAHGKEMVYYLIIFAVVMIIGHFYTKVKK